MNTKADDTLPLAETQHNDNQLAAPLQRNDMISVIERAAKDPSVDMDKMERLLAMAERLEAREAEKQFAVAFAALQSEMPQVDAVQSVPNRDGSVRFMFAPYQEIMAQVRPLLQKHGFTVSFSSEIKDDRVIQYCTVQHTGGHKRMNQFMAKIAGGPPGSSGAQADGAASTYAKRQALSDALNIVVNKDTDGMPDDARDEGHPISFTQIQTLKEMVKETESDEKYFLRFAGAATYEEIGSKRYAGLFAELQKKYRR